MDAVAREITLPSTNLHPTHSRLHSRSTLR